MEPLRILIAEDNPGDQQLMEVALEALDQEFEFKIVDNGQELLDNAGPEYQLYITDINMPRVSGIDVVKGLRARGIDRPVAILTGSCHESSLKEAVTAQANTFIVKASSAKELQENLETVLTKYLFERN